MLEALLEYRTDGLILVSPRLPRPQIARRRRRAAVRRDRAPRCATAHIDSVMTDEALGAHLAVEHLVELGHERIVHVDGGQGAGAAPRRAGYLKAMADAGLARHARVIPGEFTEDGGRGRGRGAAARRPSCRPRSSPPTTSSALGLIDRLEQDGVRMPERRVGRRLRQHVRRRAQPHPLTTINQPRHEMGREALAAAARARRRPHARCDAPARARARRARDDRAAAMSGPRHLARSLRAASAAG